MALKILVGASQWDAAAYVRHLVEDEDGLEVKDDALKTYAEDVIEDFSRHIPTEHVVGDAFAATSPLVTAKGQQRYLCDAAHGFTADPIDITDVLYRAGGALVAPNELAYLSMTAFAPIGRFLFNVASMIDSPTQRILRAEYIDEMDHYGKGVAGIGMDVSGIFFIDLFPVPAVAGLPVYVRYTAAHDLTEDVSGNLLAPTVPENRKRNFGKLLYACVLEQLGQHMAKHKVQKGGMIENQSDARTMEARIVRIREEVYAELGAYSGVGYSSS